MHCIFCHHTQGEKKSETKTHTTSSLGVHQDSCLGGQQLVSDVVVGQGGVALVQEHVVAVVSLPHELHVAGDVPNGRLDGRGQEESGQRHKPVPSVLVPGRHNLSLASYLFVYQF